MITLKIEFLRDVLIIVMQFDILDSFSLIYVPALVHVYKVEKWDFVKAVYRYIKLHHHIHTVSKLLILCKY